MIKYRDRLEIMYDMLKPMSERPMKRTRIMLHSGTSYTNFKRYFDLLEKHGLIAEKNDMEKHVVLGERGMQYLEMYEQLRGLFDGDLRE